MNRSPSFQFYPDKWIAGTMHLDAEAYRAYHRVLCWMWLHAHDQCSMPDTDDAWRMATGLNNSVLARCRIKIMHPDMELLEKGNGKIVSHGLRKESRKQKEYRVKQSVNAKTRWDKQITPMPPHIPPHIPPNMHSSCSPTPTPTPTPTPKEVREEPPTPKGEVECQFEQFYEAYPRKQGRKAAMKSWVKAKKPPLPTILAKLTEQKASYQWLRDSGQFIPMPATYITQERWNDTVLPTPGDKNDAHRTDKASREYDEPADIPIFKP